MLQAGRKVESVQRGQQGHQKGRVAGEREREATRKGKRKRVERGGIAEEGGQIYGIMDTIIHLFLYNDSSNNEIKISVMSVF